MCGLAASAIWCVWSFSKRHNLDVGTGQCRLVRFHTDVHLDG